MEVYTSTVTRTLGLSGNTWRVARVVPPAGSVVGLRSVLFQIGGSLNDVTDPQIELFIAGDSVGSSISFTGSTIDTVASDLSAPTAPSIWSMTATTAGDPPEGPRIFSSFVQPIGLKLEYRWPEGRTPLFDQPFSIACVEAPETFGKLLVGTIEWSYQGG